MTEEKIKSYQVIFENLLKGKDERENKKVVASETDIEYE